MKEEVKKDLVEIIETPKQTLVEKYVDLQDYVKIDMNVIQYPIFNISKRKKLNEIYKYYFDKNKESYLEIIPSAGNYVPGATEELVFLAIMKIFEKNAQSQEFYFTIKELMQEMKICEENFRKDFITIKKSLKRLATTNYNFKNSMYSNFHKKVIKSTTFTTLFSLQIINFEEETNEKLIKELKNRYGHKFKEICKISFNNIIHYNLIHSGHISYNYDLLLDMKDSIVRKIYIYLDKVRYSNLNYEETLETFANRIPLSIRNGNIYKLIPTLEEKFQKLINLGILKDFEIIEATPLKKSILKFSFEECCNVIKEKNLFNSINSKRNIEEIIKNDIFDIENFTGRIEKREEDVESILKILPKEFKNIKGINVDIQKSIKHYGINKVLKSAFYVNSLNQTNSTLNLRTTFKKCLKESWYEEKVKEEHNFEPKVEAIEIVETKNGKLEEELLLLMAYYLKKYDNLIINEIKEIYCKEVKININQLEIEPFKSSFTASFKILFKKLLLDNGINSLDKKENLKFIDNKLVFLKTSFLTEEEVQQEIEKFIFVYSLNGNLNKSLKSKLHKYFLLFLDYEKQNTDSLRLQLKKLLNSFEEYASLIKS